ncbi:MAG: family 20 glycosylhydrolase [Planctomycetota bacterium]
MLRRLAETAGEQCPAFELEDWPQFATRGFMLDVSRNRVPTMATLTDLIETLSALRMNHLQLYTEHTFAYAGHDDVWRMASPLTPNEVKTLDECCRERGIELAANQNCFGHLAEWLRHPAYLDLAETHGPYNFYGITRDGPFSLCPTDARSLALVRDWLAQLRECYSSPLLNIGCDETADIGTGRSSQEVERRGKAGVYADFVTEVTRVAESLGFEPMFWADVALTTPGTLERLPASLRPLAWGYEPDSPFNEWGTAIATTGRTGWVCPGTSCWRTFAGRTTERRETLNAAAASRHAFDGMLVTAWGDVGHQQQWPITLHALADAAHASWHGRANSDPGLASLLLFDNAELGPWLDELGDADRTIRTREGLSTGMPLRNASAVFDALYPANPALPPRGSLGQWRELLDRFHTLERSMPSVGGDFGLELRWTLKMSMLGCRYVVATRFGRNDPEFAAECVAARDEFERLWHTRSRPGGLERTVSLIDGLVDSVREERR